MHHGQLLPYTLILLDVHSFYALHLPVLVSHDVVWFVRSPFVRSVCQHAWGSHTPFAIPLLVQRVERNRLLWILHGQPSSSRASCQLGFECLGCKKTRARPCKVLTLSYPIKSRDSSTSADPLQLSISNNLTWFWVKADGRGACVGHRKRLGSDEPPSLATSPRSSFASSPHPRLDPRWLGSTLDVSFD